MVVIGKVKEPHGCWGNMAPYPVNFEGRLYRTTEALFQSLRFAEGDVREAIRAASSPMGAKLIAKRHRSLMVVEPLSQQDLDNMRLCLRLKVEQHPELARMLVDTKDELIVEDCTKRQRGSGLFWGAARDGNSWKGQNWLGVLWMELRSQLAVSLLGEAAVQR
jgi:ribA/ribD-fused uncharacterized protein